jgi:hypothetical protein
MPRTIKPLKDCYQTAREIARIVNRFYGDLYLLLIRRRGQKKSVSLDQLNLQEFYDFIKNIPFKTDEKPVEFVARPWYVMKEKAIDCKKKTVMVASYLKIHGVPFQLIGSSVRPDKKIHHIFARAFINRKWRTIDATYPENELFEGRTNTREVVFYDSTR